MRYKIFSKYMLQLFIMKKNNIIYEAYDDYGLHKQLIKRA